MLRLRGAHAAVEAATLRLGGELVPATEASAFWTGLRDQSDEFFVAAQVAVDAGQALWRVSVPQTAAPLQLPGESLIEWGGAQRWLVCEAGRSDAVRAAATTAGGHATLFRSHDKSAGVFTPLTEPLAQVHREMKRSFDPDGIFNPGRLYPGW